MKIKDIRKFSSFHNKNNLKYQKKRLEIFKVCRTGSFMLFLATFGSDIIYFIGKKYLNATLLGTLSALSFGSLTIFSKKIANELLENIKKYPELQNKIEKMLKYRDRSFITFLVAYPSFLGKFLEGNYSTPKNIGIGLLGGISILTCLSASILTVLSEECEKEQNNILEPELDIIDLDTEEGELKLLR